MSQIITIHGHKFAIDAQGFGRHEADKDRGVDVIITRLRKFSPERIAQIHDIDLEYQAGGLTFRPAVLDEIESAGNIEATLDWHDPNQADISLHAEA